MPSIQLKNFYRELHHRLKARHEDREARQLAFVILEETFSAKREDILAHKNIEVSNEQATYLEKVIREILQGKPVQYATGKAYCYGRRFTVNPSVLIPRQETEELIFRITEDYRQSGEVDILDIGTGSGCIAISLSLELPKSRVWALDKYPEALKTARINARALHARIHLFAFDVLSDRHLPGLYDVIVSNPPYVTEGEMAFMHNRILDYEPPGALFVTDKDPLIFYRNIAKKALQSLHPQGKLYFEINERFAGEIRELLSSYGYKDLAVYEDLNKKPRILSATNPRIPPQ